EAIRAAGVPAVNVSWSRHGEGHIPTCTADGRGAGELAVRYFLERGYTHFGYYGLPAAPCYRNDFRETFLEGVGRARHAAPGLDAPHQAGAEDGGRFVRLCAWVAALEKPVAVLTFDALFGREVTEACRHTGARVPEDVAVLSGELDDLFGSISVPRLSAI